MERLDAADRVLLKALVRHKVTQYLHGCDSYVVAFFPEGSTERDVYLEALAYWDGWFGSDSSGEPKGYVSVVDDA